jgi:hypothetical protein
VREIDLVLPCSNILSALCGWRSFLLFFVLRLYLPFMKVFLAHLKGIDGRPTLAEPFLSDGVMRTFVWNQRSGVPAELRKFSFRICDVETLRGVAIPLRGFTERSPMGF